MKKNLDMTEGKPISLLWAFTFPTLMGNLLNQVYSITDSIVVGRYLGQTALAAVGSTMPVILLLAALMIGINVGVGIIISRYFGQKNEELMRRAFVNSLYLGLFLSAGMMVMGLTFSGTILRWMGTPEGPLQEATAYLEISFITMICPLMYYLFSSAFRGLGDSQTALYCLIVSVLSNIGLDVLFVAVFRWGVAGSAWATALAQALSAVVAAVLLFVVVTKGGYQMDRIRIWLDPFSSDLDRDLTHQTRQSLYAIGSGGLLGVGLGQSRQKYLYLPAPQNDFIFAIVCEELGFVGALVIIVLFALLIWRGVYVSIHARDKFGMLLGLGITFQVGLQAVLNICVVTNTIPNTGISLPFFSYGGTALLMLLGQMGILLNISRSANVEKT